MAPMQISKPVIAMLLALCSQLAWSSEPQKDIGVSSAGAIDFVRATAKVTALAKTRQENVVKFMALGLNSSGTVVVTEMAVEMDHGASFTPTPGSIAVAHVHTKKMSAKPEAADYDTLRVFGVPCFVISADGESIWEIAILGGVDKYRAVLPSGVGEWVNH